MAVFDSQHTDSNRGPAHYECLPTLRLYANRRSGAENRQGNSHTCSSSVVVQHWRAPKPGGHVPTGLFLFPEAI